MANWYIGKGGSDSNDGTTWANRRLTLSGMDTLTYGNGDTIYIGPGDYAAVSSFSPGNGVSVTIIGDTTGENTDGVGGPVTIGNTSASNLTYGVVYLGTEEVTWKQIIFYCVDGELRLQCLSGPMHLDTCAFIGGARVEQLSTTGDTLNVKNCMFVGAVNADGQYKIYNTSETTPTAVNIENCLFYGDTVSGRGIYTENTNNIIIKNCSFYGADIGIFDNSAAGITYPAICANNLFVTCETGLDEAFNGSLYPIQCTFLGCVVDISTSGNGGGHNLIYFYEYPTTPGNVYNAFSSYPHRLYMDILSLGPISGWLRLSSTATYAPPTTDIAGLPRHTDAIFRGDGAIYASSHKIDRTFGLSSDTSLMMIYGRGVQQFKVPVNPSTEITIAVSVYRSSTYTGTLPSMIISEVGQSDRVTTDTGSSQTWNTLTDTFTPGSSTNYILVTLRALNSQTTSTANVWFDNLIVS